MRQLISFVFTDSAGLRALYTRRLLHNFFSTIISINFEHLYWVFFFLSKYFTLLSRNVCNTFSFFIVVTSHCIIFYSYLIYCNCYLDISLYSLNPSSLFLHKLKFKVGAPIILIRNLSEAKLGNGTRLRIKSLKK